MLNLFCLNFSFNCTVAVKLKLLKLYIAFEKESSSRGQEQKNFGKAGWRTLHEPGEVLPSVGPRPF